MADADSNRGVLGRGSRFRGLVVRMYVDLLGVIGSLLHYFTTFVATLTAPWTVLVFSASIPMRTSIFSPPITTLATRTILERLEIHAEIFSGNWRKLPMLLVAAATVPPPVTTPPGVGIFVADPLTP